MTPELQAEVWSMLDRERLAAIARRGPAPVFATISGAHLYGFASPDSDVDLRGAFLLSARELLGLNPAQETFSIVEKEELDLDWVAHDLRKFARLMTRHNGYVLEQLYSPLVVITSPLHDALMQLGQGCITRLTSRHYQGFARGRRKRLEEPEPSVKHLLYAYRVLLSGIHLMREGEVVSHMAVLRERFPGRAGLLGELVERKRSGSEHQPLNPAELELHAAELDALERELEAARDASCLPDEPTTLDALDDLVVAARLATAQ